VIERASIKFHSAFYHGVRYFVARM
jgi:hypothetical protein